MKSAVFILAASMMAGPIQAVEINGRSLTLSEAEAAQCAKEEGCRVISNRAVEGLLKLGFVKGYEAGLETCKEKT